MDGRVDRYQEEALQIANCAETFATEAPPHQTWTELSSINTLNSFK